MKKTFQKTLLAAAAGVALMGAASANSLLFPYFTTETGKTSILSLAGNGSLAAPETLHYVYNYGSACTHYDGNGKMTANDLLQHSIGSTAAGGFGKVVTGDTSTPFYFPLNDYGFLVVSTKSSAGAKISGDIIVYDPTSGITTSYAGITGASTDTRTTEEGNFNNIADVNFNLSFYPGSLVTTSWYGVVVGNMNTAITAGANWGGKAALKDTADGATFAVYDNDENAYSGATTKNLTCAGMVAATDLMNAAQAAAVGTNGGLIHAQATPDGTTQATGLVMTKIQVVKTTKAGLLHREQGQAF